jgi:hypothetical protein
MTLAYLSTSIFNFWGACTILLNFILIPTLPMGWFLKAAYIHAEGFPKTAGI